MSIATSQPQQRQLTPQQQKHQGLRAFLSAPGMKANLAQALPKHMTADRMIRMALTAASRNPKLLDCSMESVALALLTASQLGLEVNGRDAHLVPYKSTCQLIPDYKGLIQLGYRSGMVDNISAKAVYEKDFFEYELGSDEHLKHVPCTVDDPGELIYAWAMVRFRNGGSKFVVLNRRDIKRRKAKSQTAGREDSPWNQYPEAMWAKSAVKELAKWMPQVPELQTFHDAVEADNAAERGAVPTIIDTPSDAEEPPPSRTSELASRLAGERAATQQREQGKDQDAGDHGQADVAGTPGDTDGPTASEVRETEYADMIAAAGTLGDLAHLEPRIGSDTALDEGAIDRLQAAVNARREAIKSTRGERSNGGKGGQQKSAFA